MLDTVCWITPANLYILNVSHYSRVLPSKSIILESFVGWNSWTQNLAITDSKIITNTLFNFNLESKNSNKIKKSRYIRLPNCNKTYNEKFTHHPSACCSPSNLVNPQR